MTKTPVKKSERKKKPEDKKKKGGSDDKKKAADKKSRKKPSADRRRAPSKNRPPQVKSDPKADAAGKKAKSDRKKGTKSTVKKTRNLSEGGRAEKISKAKGGKHHSLQKGVSKKTSKDSKPGTSSKDTAKPSGKDAGTTHHSKQGTARVTQLATATPEPQDDNEYENLTKIQQLMKGDEEPPKKEKEEEAAEQKGEESAKKQEAEPPPEPAAPVKKATVPMGLEMDDLWRNLNEGDAFPTDALKALGRPLLVETSSRQEHFVALWYRHGEPIFGRAWNNQGRLAACFTHDGKVYQSNLGSIQVLCQQPPGKCGFRYLWQPFSFACAPSGGWYPIKVGDSIPCVVKTQATNERLGNVSLHQERATAASNSKEDVFVGANVRQFLVLFRKP